MAGIGGQKQKTTVSHRRFRFSSSLTFFRN